MTETLPEADALRRLATEIEVACAASVLSAAVRRVGLVAPEAFISRWRINAQGDVAIPPWVLQILQASAAELAVEGLQALNRPPRQLANMSESGRGE